MCRICAVTFRVGGIGGQGFAQPAITANAADGSVQIVVNRSYYSAGPISVTLTPVPGTATSEDFSATPLTLSWADGDSGPQTATIPIVKANIVVGSPKSFTVDLTNPTNGAVLSPQAHALVTINATRRRRPEAAACSTGLLCCVLAAFGASDGAPSWRLLLITPTNGSHHQNLLRSP